MRQALDTNTGDRGRLTVINGTRDVPFDIKRVFYMWHVPPGTVRGKHALKTCDQFVVAIAGSFMVAVDNGKTITKYYMNRPDEGLSIPAMTWREVANFSSNAVCLVFASERYDEAAYYRDYEEWLRAIGKS